MEVWLNGAIEREYIYLAGAALFLFLIKPLLDHVIGPLVGVYVNFVVNPITHFITGHIAQIMGVKGTSSATISFALTPLLVIIFLLLPIILLAPFVIKMGKQIFEYLTALRPKCIGVPEEGVARILKMSDRHGTYYVVRFSRGEKTNFHYAVSGWEVLVAPARRVGRCLFVKVPRISSIQARGRLYHEKGRVEVYSSGKTVYVNVELNGARGVRLEYKGAKLWETKESGTYEVKLFKGEGLELAMVEGHTLDIRRLQRFLGNAFFCGEETLAIVLDIPFFPDAKAPLSVRVECEHNF